MQIYFLMIWLKHNGQIFMFNSDSRWPSTREELVGGSLQILLIDLTGYRIRTIQSPSE